MNDRLLQLALFVRTVESGSFSKAAREFGLSQPSVSRAIAALERRLGVKLLVRTTRQVSATDAEFNSGAWLLDLGLPECSTSTTATATTTSTPTSTSTTATTTST